MGGSKEKQDYMVVKAQLLLSYSPVDLNRHFTHKAVYLAPGNMHTNHILIATIVNKSYKNHAGIEAS